MCFSLNTSVTCASSHLICHNIFPFSSCDALQADCSLPSVKSGNVEKVNKRKGRTETLNCIMAIMLERCISLQLAERRMRLWLLMSLRGGTCVETKGCACRPYQTPPPTPPLLPSPERDRPRAERRSLPGGVIRLGPKSPAGRPVCDWRRPSPALVTGWHLWQAGDSFSRQVH